MSDVSERDDHAMTPPKAARSLALALFASVAAPNVVMAVGTALVGSTREIEATLAMAHGIASASHALFATLAAWLASSFARSIAPSRAGLLRVMAVAYSAVAVALLVPQLAHASSASLPRLADVVGLLFVVAIARATAHASVRAYRAGRVAVGCAVACAALALLTPADDATASVATALVVLTMNLAAWIATFIALWLASIDLRPASP